MSDAAFPPRIYLIPGRPRIFPQRRNGQDHVCWNISTPHRVCTFVARTVLKQKGFWTEKHPHPVHRLSLVLLSRVDVRVGLQRLSVGDSDDR